MKPETIARKVRQPDGSLVTLKPGEDPETYSQQPARNTTPTIPSTSTTGKTDSRWYTGKNGMEYDQYGGSRTPVFTPRSESAIEVDLMKSAQGTLAALDEHYSNLLKEQSVINEKADRSTASISTLTGLAGSTEANIQQGKTTAVGQQQNQKIMAEKQLAIQQVLGQIKGNAVAQARAEREEARMSEQQRLENRKAMKQEALDNLTMLSAGGVTYDGLKSGDPDSFKYLVNQFGSEEALRGAFVLNTPQDQILDKRIENGKYIIAKQNPVTGKISIESTDLGLPTGYSKTMDAGDRIVAIPDNWDGDVTKLRSISKGLEPGKANGKNITTDGKYSNDLDAVLGATLSTIPTQFGQEQFQAQIASARNDGDKINLVAAQVLRGQPAEFKRDFANQAIGISEIDKAIKTLDEGVKTGVLNNTLQYTFNVFGKDYDPKLAKINGHITSAIQPYRNSITGAAWGDQEDAEYQSLFGSTKYSPTELKQRLLQTKELLKSRSATGLNSFVNPLGLYGNQFETGSLAPTGGRMLVSPDGQQFDASDLTPQEYQEAVNDGYIPQ